MMAFIPIFFFASEYAQIALAQDRVGGRHLPALLLRRVRRRRADRRPDPRPRRGQARRRPRLCHRRGRASASGPPRRPRSASASSRSGSSSPAPGMGMMLGPANTDAVNRASNLSYGEATGITQTIRNFGASLGLAALGTILLFNFRSHLTTSLQKMGVPTRRPWPTASRSPSTAADRCPPSRTTSRSTSPRHPDGALRDVRHHGLRRRSSPCSASSGAARRCPSTRRRRRRPRPTEPLGSTRPGGPGVEPSRRVHLDGRALS